MVVMDSNPTALEFEKKYFPKKNQKLEAFDFQLSLNLFNFQQTIENFFDAFLITNRRGGALQC